jgi:hypothetical protein
MAEPDNNSREAFAARLSPSAGEAALQLVELIMLTLIDRKLIGRDELIHEIESLAAATPEIAPAQLKTLKARLGEVAGSLSGHASVRSVDAAQCLDPARPR